MDYKRFKNKFNYDVWPSEAHERHTLKIVFNWKTIRNKAYGKPGHMVNGPSEGKYGNKKSVMTKVTSEGKGKV
jgi:hypothetical protein